MNVAAAKQLMNRVSVIYYKNESLESFELAKDEDYEKLRNMEFSDCN